MRKYINIFLASDLKAEELSDARTYQFLIRGKRLALWEKMLEAKATVTGVAQTCTWFLKKILLKFD